VATATAFDTADVELLLERYADDGSEEPRRRPRVRAALNEPERLVLLRMCEVYDAPRRGLFQADPCHPGRCGWRPGRRSQDRHGRS
jgi:hypothetical protein